MLSLGPLLPFAEDAFQVLRRGDVKNFFKKENLGLAGLFVGQNGKNGFSRLRWAKNTFAKGPADFTFGGGVLPFAVMGAAYLGSRAGQGQVVSTSAGFLAGMMPAGLGAMVAGGPGALATGVLFGEPFGHAVRSKVQSISRRARTKVQFEMGDEFVESEAIWTMRQRAAADMSGSLLNARQVLGREAALMHE
jgi:hypothetical protein